MTLRTITFDDSTHKLVPIIADESMLQKGEYYCESALLVWRDMIAAAPEYCDKSLYQEPEQICDDGGKCGAGGYCNNCAEPDNQITKQAERYEKVRKLNAQQFAELYKMNIQGSVPFDELVDRLGKDE